ncbi:hypothetical protein V2I01_32175 [Micromonospora sp. BRA006-A]|nr:hypothetical protein [Micromonospora sp. BRA006-A]
MAERTVRFQASEPVRVKLIRLGYQRDGQTVLPRVRPGPGRVAAAADAADEPAGGHPRRLPHRRGVPMDRRRQLLPRRLGHALGAEQLSDRDGGTRNPASTTWSW